MVDWVKGPPHARRSLHPAVRLLRHFQFVAGKENTRRGAHPDEVTGNCGRRASKWVEERLSGSRFFTSTVCGGNPPTVRLLPSPSAPANRARGWRRGCETYSANWTSTS